MLLLETIRLFLLKNSQWLRYLVLPALMGMAFLAGQSRHKKALRICENERAGLIVDAARLQMFRDSLYWSARLETMNEMGLRLTEQNYYLREKITTDSITRLSDLAAMRAVNTYIKRKR
jgi:hypothetical protein